MADGFIFRSSYYEAAKALPKKEQVNVILAVCGYVFDQAEPELNGLSKAVFDLIRLQLDAELAAEAQRGKDRIRSQRYRDNRRDDSRDNHGDNHGDSNGDNHETPPSSPLKPPNNPQKERVSKDTPKKKTPKEFVPPTLEEVEAYCKQRNSSVNPKDFFDFFDAGDWYDSKGNPVIAWKQKLITWEKHNPKPKEEAPVVEEVTRPRWIETAPFEGYWEYFENGEWVRHDDW